MTYDEIKLAISRGEEVGPLPEETQAQLVRDDAFVARVSGFLWKYLTTKDSLIYMANRAGGSAYAVYNYRTMLVRWLNDPQNASFEFDPETVSTLSRVVGYLANTAGYPDSNTIQSIVGHPSFPEAEVGRLTDDRKVVRYLLEDKACRAKISPDKKESLAGLKDLWVIDALLDGVENTADIPKAGLDTLIDRVSVGALTNLQSKYLARNAGLEDDQIRRLNSFPVGAIPGGSGLKSYIEAGLALNPKTPKDLLVELSNKSEDAQIALSTRNGPLPEEALETLKEKALTSSSLANRLANRKDLDPEYVNKLATVATQKAKEDRSWINTLAKVAHNNKDLLTPETVRNIIESRASAEATINLLSHPSVDVPTLKELSTKRGIDKEVRVAAKTELTWRDPDVVHKERINVAFNTNKLRILRDKIAELGFDQATPKELPKDLVQAIGSTGRLPNGNYSTKLLQAAIDSAPRTPFNISHGKWSGAQRHSNEPSKVFQLNLTTEMAQKLKDAGVYDTYRKLWDRSNGGGHPIGTPGIGWVRWTGSKKDGVHIDEMQSDFGQRLSRMIEEQAAEARAQGYSNEEIDRHLAELKKDFPEDKIDKINEIVFGGKHSSALLMEAFHEWARTHQAEVKDITPDKRTNRVGRSRLRHIGEVKFEKDHSRLIKWIESEEGKEWVKSHPDEFDLLQTLEGESVLSGSRAPWLDEERQRKHAQFALLANEHTGQNFFDASMSRYNIKKEPKVPKVYESLVGAKVATWQPETKAPISGLKPDKPLPKHIVVGHRDQPEKMGFKPGVYGNLPTQKGPHRTISPESKRFYAASGRDPWKGQPKGNPDTDPESLTGFGAPTMEEEIRKNNEGFLEAVLGIPGANALLKAAERSPVMASAMLPRAVIAWLEFATRWPYNGPIPGCANTHIEFAKSELGFTGAIEANGESYEFQDAQMLQLAAAVGVALGWDDVQPSDKLTKSQVDAVGNQLDLLVKATYLNKAKIGHDKPGAPVKPAQGTNPKTTGFQEPMSPQKGAQRKGAFKSEESATDPKDPKKKKRKLKIKKSQAVINCSVCDAPQFDSGDLTLCHCLRELRKSVKSTPVNDGFEVEFGADWADSDIQVFLDMMEEPK